MPAEDRRRGDGPAGGLRLTLSDGSHLDTGLLILAIGVKPETLLAAKAWAGLLGPRGGIKVDAGMRTSDPFIFAVGTWGGGDRFCHLASP